MKKKTLLVFLLIMVTPVLLNAQAWRSGMFGGGGGGLTSGTVSGGAVLVVASDSLNALLYTSISKVVYLCTGTNDQTTINTAIVAVSPGGRVILSDGIFSINNVTAQAYGIYLSDTNNNFNVTLEGQGMGTLLKVPTGNAAILEVIRAKGNSVALTGVRIKNLRIDGNRSNVTGDYYMGVALDNVSDVSVDGVYLSNGKGLGGSGYGYWVNASTDVTIRNSTGLDWDFEPLELRDSSRVLITNNTLGRSEVYDNCSMISFTNNTFMTDGISIGTDTSTSSFATGIKVNFNTFNGSGPAFSRTKQAEAIGNVHNMSVTDISGVGSTATSSYLTVIGNTYYISFAGLTGVSGTWNYSIISGNHFYSTVASTTAISLQAGTYNLVSGNYSFNSVASAVFMSFPSGCNYNLIDGNFCYGGLTCIKADGSATNYNVISNNQFYGSLGYGIEVYGTGNIVKDNNTSQATYSISAIEDYGSRNIINGAFNGSVARTLSIKEVTGTTIYNTGQGPNSINHTLPLESYGFYFRAIVGEAQAANTFKFTSTTAGAVCLDGTCGKNYVAIAAPTQGAEVECKTVKSASTGTNGSATLAMATDTTSVKNALFTFDVAGAGYSKAAVDGTAPGNDVIPQSKYGAVAFDIGADGTIDAIEASANATGYDSAALAIAGVPALEAGHVRMGYVTAMKSDGAFTFGGTALNAENTTVAYTQATAYTKPYWWVCKTITGTWSTD